ncbi:hypothetical protein [Streptomyces sp. SPB162]|uniref:hypothetical protein n=1 Tax=Streptomyces sp. SPB162 TaxID=2940560 RepID=UPI002407047F|nr:hypothetical protein [Streptomyces sp. SPB162]MDF9815737.1 hypothetical protein [Streptomyces sp. SPB162]
MADPLDDRLRDLARDTGPLIVLAAPADVRRRGERRRARRRVGAVAVVAAAALAVGTWAVVPRLENGAQAPMVGGSPSPDPLPTEDLSGEMLRPTALPWDSVWQWHIAPEGVAADAKAKIPLMLCGTSLYDPASASVRFFLGNETSSARHTVHALRDEAAADTELDRVSTELGKCGLVSSYRSGKEEGVATQAVLRVYGVTKRDGWQSQVWLAVKGRYMSLLQVVTPVIAGLNTPYSDGTPVVCMTRSLDRLAPSRAAPATPTTSPSTGFAGGYPAGADPTAGGGTTGDQPPDTQFPPTHYAVPTSSDRC